MPKEIKRIGSAPSLKSGAKTKEAKRFESWFLQRQRYLIDRQANDGKRLHKPTLWQKVLGLFSPKLAGPPPLPPAPPQLTVNTPIVACNIQPLFLRGMGTQMDAAERAEHVRLALEHKKILPLCQYKVLYFTEIPSWYREDRPVVTRRRYLPKDVVEDNGYEGVLISLSRSRLIATELASQGAFGAIVGYNPQGFFYEVFGPYESFTRAMIRDDRLAKEYKAMYVTNRAKNIVEVGRDEQLTFHTPEIQIEIDPSEVYAEEPISKINRRFLRRK